MHFNDVKMIIVVCDLCHGTDPGHVGLKIVVTYFYGFLGFVVGAGTGDGQFTIPGGYLKL